MSVLIPQGFYRIVCSELRSAKAEVMYNPARRKFIVKVTSGVEGENVTLLGPFAQFELEAVVHALTDVFNMKGEYGAC